MYIYSLIAWSLCCCASVKQHCLSELYFREINKQINKYLCGWLLFILIVYLENFPFICFLPFLFKCLSSNPNAHTNSRFFTVSNTGVGHLENEYKTIWNHNLRNYLELHSGKISQQRGSFRRIPTENSSVYWNTKSELMRNYKWSAKWKHVMTMIEEKDLALDLTSWEIQCQKN